MKKCCSIFLLILLLIDFTANTACSQGNDLKLVFIRHGEKASTGDNLNCQGLNRSMMLPAVLFKKFGKPNNIYVPTLGKGKGTKHARMFQTITPFASKYNININSAYDDADYKQVSQALLSESGTIFIVWEHNGLESIVKNLVGKRSLNWPDSDFDSIWIVTFTNGKAVLTRDKEGLTPTANCPF